jgi:biopolymer transport protein ExbD
MQRLIPVLAAAVVAIACGDRHPPSNCVVTLYPPSSTDRVLYLRAHKELKYARVLTAMDIARNNGVNVVGMITERRTP